MKNIKRSYIIIGAVVVGVILLLVIISNLFNSGSLEVTSPSTPNNAQITLKFTYDGGSTETFSMAPSTTRSFNVKTGTVRVDSSVGDLQAVDIIKVNASSTTKLTLKFGTSMTATKIGTDAEYCPYVVGTTLFTYNCQGDGFIYRHDSPDARKIPIMDSGFYGNVHAYANGFLGIPITNPNDTSRAGLQLFFIDPVAQTQTQLTMPSGIPTDNMSDKTRVVTSTDPTKTFFAIVVPEANTLYLFKDITDQNPITIKIPDNKQLTGGNISSFSFNGDTLIAYAGHAVNADQDEGAADNNASGGQTPSKQKSDGKIYEFDLTGKLLKSTGVPDDFETTQVNKIGDNYYTSAQTTGVDVYYLRDNRLEHIYSLNDASTTLVRDNTLYMVAGQSVFAFTPKQDGLFGLENVYNDSKKRVSRLYSSKDSLLFTAFEGDSTDTPLNIFTLK